MNKFPYYWICHACATAKGGVLPKVYCGTVADISCKYCNDRNRVPGEFTTPWVDYDWPKEDAQTNRIAKGTRD